MMLNKLKPLISVALLMLALTSAFPHGSAGKRFFPTTLFVDDPFMNDEFSLIVNHNKIQSEESNGSVSIFDISGEYAKTIIHHFGLSLAEHYQFMSSHEEESQSGLGNMELSLKYQFLTSSEHETVLSIGTGFEIQATGSSKIAGEDYSVITPALFFGKGLGDFNSESLLRPLAVTGQLGLAIPTKSSADKILEWGFALEYSLLYLQSFVKDIGLGSPFNRMTILIEFPFESALNGNKKTKGYISPGVVWMGKYIQLGLEAEIPTNNNTGNSVGFAGIFHLFLDDIFPKSLGEPIF